MNYKKIYDSIIKNAKSEIRIKHNGIYYEKHHIFPKCLGGSDEKENLVLLTAREHFICHKLLIYIYDNNKLIYAFNRLVNDKRLDRKVTSKDYQYCKELFNSRSFAFSDEHKKNLSKSRRQKNLAKGKNNGMFGRFHSNESKEKMSLQKKGKKHSCETKKKIGLSMKGKRSGSNHPLFGKPGVNLGKKVSLETINNMKKAKEHISDKTKQKMSLSAKRQKQCEHCKKICNIGNYNRWHGNNCKYK